MKCLKKPVFFRAQISVEMLINYLWAAIMIVIMTSVLYQFGFFSHFLSPYAAHDQVSGFGTFDAYFRLQESGNVSFYLTNLGGGTVNITYIRVNGELLSEVNPSLPVSLSQGRSTVISGLSSVTGSVGDRFSSVPIEIRFDTSSYSGHIDSGIMEGFVQPG